MLILLPCSSFPHPGMPRLIDCSFKHISYLSSQEGGLASTSYPAFLSGTYSQGPLQLQDITRQIRNRNCAFVLHWASRMHNHSLDSVMNHLKMPASGSGCLQDSRHEQKEAQCEGNCEAAMGLLCSVSILHG